LAPVKFRFHAKQTTAELNDFGLKGGIKPQDKILDYELPHHGPASKTTCGQLGHRAHFASKGAHWMSFRKDCREFQCGTCKSEKLKDGSFDLRGWEAREAFAIRDRIDHYRDGKTLADFPTHFLSTTKNRFLRQKRAPPVYHVVISPPQDWAKQTMWSRQGYKAMWGQLYRVAASRGIVGGVAIFHPARIPSKWNQRTCMASGPHWHVLGIMRWGDAYDAHVCSALSTGRQLTDHSRLKSTLMALGMAKKATQAVAGDGWIVKVLPKRKDVASTAAYVLSHAGRPLVPGQSQHGGDRTQGRPKGAYPASPQGSGEWQGKALNGVPVKALGVVPHWFGVLAYNKLKVPECAESGILCPICATVVPMDDWHQVVWADPDVPPPDGRHGTTNADAWMLLEEVADSPWARDRFEQKRQRFEFNRAVAL
jgi:hypothetical protein